jgi:NAD(P)-dependent dehydrogenase (short-subunit alcohol dehydrogenase family)
MARYSGKVVLVTGAGRGIGAALARGFADEGATVIVTDMDQALATASASAIVAAGGNAHAHRLDVTDAASVKTLIADVVGSAGRLDVLVNNAGILIREPFETRETQQVFERTFAVNLHGAVALSDAALPALAASRGAILNVASIQAFASLRNSVAYTTSKAAIAQFTKALAVEVAARGIRVNALAPGIIETDISAATRSDPARLAKFLERVPMGRTGTPDDLIEPALFLCSPGAAYVTGAILAVDGGFLAL